MTKKTKTPSDPSPELDFEWGVAYESGKFWFWTTKDCKVRVARVTSESGEGIYFGVEFWEGSKEKGSYGKCIPTSQGSTYARHFPSLKEAFEAGEKARAEKFSFDSWTSNKEQRIAEANKLGLAYGSSMQAVKRSYIPRAERVGETSLVASEGQTPKVVKPAPVVKGRVLIFGYSATTVVHYLAQNGFDKAQIRKILDKMGSEGTSDASIQTGICDSRNPKYAKPAPLTKEQEAQLRSKL